MTLFVLGPGYESLNDGLRISVTVQQPPCPADENKGHREAMGCRPEEGHAWVVWALPAVRPEGGLSVSQWAVEGTCGSHCDSAHIS